MPRVRVQAGLAIRRRSADQQWHRPIGIKRLSLPGERVHSPKRLRGRRQTVGSQERFRVLARLPGLLYQRPGHRVSSARALLSEPHFLTETFAQKVGNAPCEAVPDYQQLPDRLLEARTLEVHPARTVDQPDR